MALKKFDQFSIMLAAGAGLFGAALAASPGATSAPLPLGGPTCLEQMAGLAAPAGAPPVIAPILPGPPVAGAVPLGPALPAALPGAAALPASALPVGAPLPAGAPVIAGTPLPAAAGGPDGTPAGAPLLQQAATGKGVPTHQDRELSADPVVLPGPPPAPAPATLAAATAPLPPCCNP
ncbi:hypothetical protein MB901379_03166 [Mycobacterium basiliense]|uniref:Beta antigen n=1 Tax=Mycobacterium basiliense TaxID=2094119 RepID=A0A3S4FS75_9MYCO|nr:hypothetical protein [Mycobacterium basiliense]VDM89588.1 hypothetical protein MB901379_03166 [Mycobacterium basiliense]